MKKLLGIVVLGLLLCSKAYAKDLTGTKLLCSKIFKKYTGEVTAAKYTAIEFLSENTAKRYWINIPRQWKIYSKTDSYKVSPDTISIGIFSIDRETLIFDEIGDQYCEIQPEGWNPGIEIKIILDQLLKEQESKNKL